LDQIKKNGAIYDCSWNFDIYINIIYADLTYYLSII
jgi:hypothetical protein